MKILGINISHDPSIASVNDGEPEFVFDEPRFRRDKWWTPSPDDHEFESIHQRVNPDEYDEVIFASFDRRSVDYEVEKDELSFDKLKAREFLEDFRSQHLSRSRLEELRSKYNGNFKFHNTGMTADRSIITPILENQLNRKSNIHTFDILNHHIYHAYCGYRLSPAFARGEDAIAIAWDGGGSCALGKEYPGYQEIESIYRCSPETLATLQWQKLSNQRCADQFSGEFFPNELEDCTWCDEDETLERDGVTYVLTSNPSSGMNFSQMSAALGCDEQGRAAGKVMGMASYNLCNRDNVFTQHTVAQELEIKSLEKSIETIQRAIDMNPNVKNIILSGGFSLNCTNNYKYLSAFPDYDFFVDPVPHDGGTALGAALWLHERLQGEENGASNEQSD